jgi:hypothetical protein
VGEALALYLQRIHLQGEAGSQPSKGSDFLFQQEAHLHLWLFSGK